MTRQPWNERLVRHAITEILDEAVDAGPPEEGPWSAGVYEGVAGSVYALRTLGKPVDWPLRAGEGVRVRGG